MSEPIRFVMVGGFLGAGKTTLISRLAAAYQSQGLHVGIVTNDQATGLVDTRLLESQGYDVNEVAGSCFCCNFDGLVDAMQAFGNRQRPDVILAEPVGSCTDLIATIAIPMAEQLGQQFTHSPYAVVLKPSHGKKILAGSEGGGFSPKAEYIFRKQLEESEIVVLNRIDELPADEVRTLRTQIQTEYPGRRIIGLSAKTGENLDELIDALDSDAAPINETMQVDYDEYAEGEAELGWLNATAQFRSSKPIALDRLAEELVSRMQIELLTAGAEPAHLKILCQAGDATAMANLVSSDTPATLSVASDAAASEIQLLVNARVAAAPEVLEPLTRKTLEQIASNRGAECQVADLACFRPGRPVPTHRVQR